MNKEFDIIENPLVFLWFKDLAKNDPLAFSTIIGPNKENFRNNFGQPTKVENKAEHWTQDYMGIKISLITDNQRTHFKVSYLGEKDIFIQDRKMGTYINSFMNKLIENLNKFDK